MLAPALHLESVMGCLIQIWQRHSVGGAWEMQNQTRPGFPDKATKDFISALLLVCITGDILQSAGMRHAEGREASAHSVIIEPSWPWLFG